LARARHGRQVWAGLSRHGEHADASVSTATGQSQDVWLWPMKVTLRRFLPSVLRIGHLNGIITGNRRGSLRPNSSSHFCVPDGPDRGHQKREKDIRNGNLQA
jgi:hypothetical protein